MKKYLLASALVISGQMLIVKDYENPEKVLTLCYKKYPFFLDAIVLISDHDYSDKQKSQARLSEIQKKLHDLNTADVKHCLDTIVRFSKESQDSSIAEFVEFRTSEVAQLLNPSVILMKASAPSGDVSKK